jgi:predicted deacylase
MGQRSVRAAWLLLAAAALAACGVPQRSRPIEAFPPASEIAVASHKPALGADWQSIGDSVQGRPLLVAQSGTGPLRIYFIGGIHGDETEGRSSLEWLRDEVHAGATIRILRDLNPDGTAAQSRGNANGRDLNRNWPAANFDPQAAGSPAPLSEPETRALARDLRAFDPHLVVVLHSINIGPLVNYDGPAEALAAAFVAAARGSDPRWQVKRDLGYSTPGSLGSYLGVERGTPILTVEFGRYQDEASARAALRKGLAALVLAAPPVAGQR